MNEPAERESAVELITDAPQSRLALPSPLKEETSDTPPPIAQPEIAVTPPFRVPGPNPLSAAALYIFTVFIGAALIAPRLYASVHFIAEQQPGWRTIVEIADLPFHRFVGRSLQMLGILGLPLFIRALHIPSARALGFRFQPRFWAQAAQGFAWGFVIVAVGIALALSSGARAVDSAHGPWSKLIAESALVGLAVGVLEEILYRGALFGSLRRRYTFWTAGLISSGFYALVHFLERPNNPPEVTWYAGFVTLGQMLNGFTEIQALIPGFFNLAVIGLILAVGFERTGSLLFCIGLHASLVFSSKLAAASTTSVAGANAWAWGSGKLVDGWALCCLLLAVFFLLTKLLPTPAQKDV